MSFRAGNAAPSGNGNGSGNGPVAATGVGGSHRGVLVFDGSFECANIGEVKMITEDEYELSLRPDTLAPQHRLWFYFSVANARAGQRCLLSVINFSKQRSLFRDGMTPLVRSSSRPAWERLPARSVFYYRSPRHKMAYVLSFVFVFEAEEDKHVFAYSFPFSYTDQFLLLESLEARKLPHVRRGLLCRSPQGRRVDALTISSEAAAVGKASAGAMLSTAVAAVASVPPAPLAPGPLRNAGAAPGTGRPCVGAGTGRPVVFVTARVHPGETPGSFLTWGLVQWLSGDDPAAVRLRSAVTFVVIPMLNPDGTFLGNYRTDAIGNDLNRLWGSPTKDLEPALLHAKALMHTYAADAAYDPQFYIDVHAHSTMGSSFFLCNPPAGGDDRAALERIALLPRLLASNARGFSYQVCRLDTDPAKAGTGRRVVGAELPGLLCYTLEASFFTPGEATEAAYLEFGRALGLSLSDYYTLLASGGAQTGPGDSGGSKAVRRIGNHQSTLPAMTPSAARALAGVGSAGVLGGSGRGAGMGAPATVGGGGEQAGRARAADVAERCSTRDPHEGGGEGGGDGAAMEGDDDDGGALDSDEDEDAERRRK